MHYQYLLQIMAGLQSFGSCASKHLVDVLDYLSLKVSALVNVDLLPINISCDELHGYYLL